MAPIIRTCSLALALALIASPALAARGEDDGLFLYARARMADATGDPDGALAIYQAALTASPANPSVAMRAYREAVEAGDKKTALRAARTLERIEALPNDAAILLFIDEVQRADWRAAERRIDEIEASQSYAFMAAPLRAWMLVGARKGDPLAPLDARIRDAIGYELVKEQRALIQLATGQAQEGADAIKGLTTRGVFRTQMRLMAASRLQQLKRPDLALGLLEENEPEFAAARAVLEGKLPLPESITTAQAGLSEMLARVALIMLAERAPQTGLVMARFARFADPQRSYPKLVSAVLLNNNERFDDALAELSGLDARPLTARWAAQTRFEVLQRSERRDAALTLAQEQAQRPGAGVDDDMKLGEAYAALNKQREAAAAFGAAIARVTAQQGEAAVPWHFWLQQGRALEEAGDWKAAKPLLERAVKAAPDQATALNHLGYSMLENGENAADALGLLVKARNLRPDDAAITDSLGWAWVKQGEVAKGIELLEQAAEREPALAEISEHLGDAYWKAGRKIDARYAWRNALVQSDGADATRLTGKIDFGLPAKP